MVRIARGIAWVALVLAVAACGDDTTPKTKPGTGGAAGVGDGGGAGEGGSGGVGEGGEGGQGGEPGGPGGTGGSAGEGGGAGEGGSGGVGGGGGDPCGNGVQDEGEECDDGNFDDFDGCSADCSFVGTCEKPFQWDEIIQGTGKNGEEQGPILRMRGFPGGDSATCGGGGFKAFIRYVPKASGMLRLFVDSAVTDELTVYARRDCADEGTEVPGSCGHPRAGASPRFRVEEGEAITLVVDMRLQNGMVAYWPSLLLTPLLEEGARCFSTQECGPGLTCEDLDAPLSCSPNEAPSLDGAAAARGGPGGEDLFLQVSGADGNGDAVRVVGWLFDAAGGPVAATKRRVGGVNEMELARIFGATEQPTKAFGRALRSVNFFLDQPSVASLDLAVEDSAMARSEVVSVPVEELSLVEQEEECDPERMRDACVEGAYCAASNRCEALVPARQASCGEAPMLSLGDPVDFTFDVRWDPPPPVLWPVPTACHSDLAKRDGLYQQMPQQVARLILDRDRTNVRIHAATEEDLFRADLSLMLLQGCGEESPLHCVDDADDGPDPELLLPSLAAGEYLVVVTPVVRPRSSGEWTLVVSADP